MALQYYTAVMKVLKYLKCAIYGLKSSLTFNRECEHHLGDSMGSSTWISHKAINIDTSILLRGND